MKLRFAIVDDESYIRKRMESLLKKIPDSEVIISSGDPEDAIRKILFHKPDIVFMDIEMPRMNGFEVVESIKEKGFSPVFIFVTAFNQYAIKAIKSAAFDFILKPVDIDELANTIARYEKIHNGNTDRIKDNPRFSELTEREKEITRLLLNGLTSRNIAEKLFISKNTVDTHRRNILRRLNLKNTIELFNLR